MKHILKRLELIKTSISIEDEEIIDLQVMKLKSIECDNEVKEILTQISSSNYGDVVILIDNYISKYSGMVVYEDKELQGLKLELKVLENRLQELSQKRDEYNNDINEFNILYSLKLGKLIKNILKLRKEILYKQTIQKEEEYQKTKNEYEELKSQKVDLEERLKSLDEFDDEYDEVYEELQGLNENINKKRKETKEAKEEIEEDPKHQEYEESKKEYEEFSSEYEEIKNEERFEIDEDDKKELKKLFRRASKLCHPDIVVDELKEQATEIMKELNNAYTRKDLSKIKELLHLLESGLVFTVASDSIDNKELLKDKIIDIRKNIETAENEIANIKTDDTFETINNIDDWDEYFESLETELQKEYDKLKDNLQDLEKPKIKQSLSIEEEYKNIDTGINDVFDGSNDYWKEEF